MDPAGLVKGLISFANLELYNKARIAFPPPANYVRPKEDIAIQVLENVLNKVVFVGKEYSTVFVNSQVPPHETSSLKADLAIKYMTKAQRLWTLCFIEGKRTSRTQSYSTRAVEEEALDYCKEYFANRSNTDDFVYAGTLVGVHLRLWIVYREDMSLTPLWGSPHLGSNEDYKDLGDNVHGPEILKAFHDMIRVAPRPWVGASSPGVIPSRGGGAIQLPKINQPVTLPRLSQNPTPTPVHPSVSIGPTTSGPPAGYTKVTKFLVITSSYAWMTSAGETGSGRAAEWGVEGRYLLNKTKRLYADRSTENLPTPL
jgi:hypothetical protein